MCVANSCPCFVANRKCDVNVCGCSNCSNGGCKAIKTTHPTRHSKRLRQFDTKTKIKSKVIISPLKRGNRPKLFRPKENVKIVDYIVESITHHKYVQNNSKNPKDHYVFFVKWLGYSSEHNTYEPVDNLIDCSILNIY
jgi:hypothetical protein